MAALNIGEPGGRSARSTSAAVKTPTTPGAARASSTSTDSSRAWAIVERT